MGYWAIVLICVNSIKISMLQDNQVTILKNLLEQGRTICGAEPTAAIKRQQIEDARRQVTGSGLLDLAAESVIQSAGADIGADIGKMLGFRSSTGRKIGKRTGGNIARQARKNRIMTAEKNAIEGYTSQRRNWESTANGWMGEARRILADVYPNPSPGVRDRSICDKLVTKLHSTGGITARMRCTMNMVDQIVANTLQYVSRDEWNAFQAARKVTPTTLVKRGEPGKGFDLVQQIINRAGQCIDWQDAYGGIYNLISLKSSSKKCKIRLLVGGKAHIGVDFKALVMDLRRSGYDLEVRITGTDTPFHDRFLITEREVWHIGTSANGLGSKDAIVSQISDGKDIRERFEELWRGATPLIF